MSTGQIYFIIFLLAITNAITWHVDNKFHQADLATSIEHEQEQHQIAQRGANDHAADLEKQLAAERQKSLTLNQQLEAAYVKVANNCPVPANLVRMRNEAIGK